MIGQQIGDYRVTKQLGEGGMGMVFLGQHALLGQKVAIKALHPSLFNNENARDRFVREAEVLAKLNHANIIRLLNFYNLPQGCFIVMEFAEGEVLEDKIQRMGLIPPSTVIPWFVGVCRALGYAHKQGIVHRDLKPSNIMIASDGSGAKLLDFGTAKLADAKKLTQQGMTLGTMVYMSKEQLLGKPLDGRSDIYSLGVTLYEATTGQLPFYDEEERKLVLKIAKEAPIPPSQHYPPMPKELERIILKAMAKEPEQRFQTADEFAQALEQFAAGNPVTIPAGPAVAPVPVAPAPVVTTPAPAVRAPAPAPAAGEARNPLLHPLVLLGVALAIVGVAAGVPLIVLGRTTPGLVVLAAGVPLGIILLFLGVVAGMRAAATAAAGRTANVVAGPGGKPLCPKCGRALLPGMTDCPFCSKPAGSPAPAPAPVPAAPYEPAPAPTINQAFVARPAPSVSGVAPPAVGAAVFVVDGPDKGKQFPLPIGAAIIGRSPTNAVPLNDPGVSSQHASITFDGSQYVLQDLGSRNGVYVNNQKVQRHVLLAGELIVVGSSRLLVNMRA